MSAQGTPSETPGHKVLTPAQHALVQEARLLGADLQLWFDARAQDPNVDPRWLAIAKTHAQQSLMAAVRAITKPDFF